MAKGCGSTIWRTYKSEVRGKPERVRPDDPTDPWVELSRKTCSNGPPARETRHPTFLSRKRQGGARKAAVAAGVREAGHSSLLVREPLAQTAVPRVLADYSGPIMILASSLRRASGEPHSSTAPNRLVEALFLPWSVSMSSDAPYWRPPTPRGQLWSFS
jgi:hypothetical protein